MSSDGVVMLNKTLTIFVHGGGDLYRAHCPELDISYYGPTPQAAADSLYSMAELEARGILEGKGRHSPDERVEYAELVVQAGDVRSLFQAGSGPPPPLRGLK